VAVSADRRQHVDRALERVEHVPLVAERDGERLVVIVAAVVAARHESSFATGSSERTQLSRPTRDRRYPRRAASPCPRVAYIGRQGRRRGQRRTAATGNRAARAT